MGGQDFFEMVTRYVKSFTPIHAPPQPSHPHLEVPPTFRDAHTPSPFIMNNPIRLCSNIVTTLLALAFAGPLSAIELPGAGALADLIMVRFDTNGDSKIDTGEWQMGATGSFDEINADRDGKITATEVDALGEPIRNEAGAAAGTLVPKLIKPLILAMDADGDGAVSKEEFTKKLEALFAKLDANTDAQLTRVELIELPVKLLPTDKK